jgi:hypothetical protein
MTVAAATGGVRSSYLSASQAEDIMRKNPALFDPDWKGRKAKINLRDFGLT